MPCREQLATRAGRPEATGAGSKRGEVRRQESAQEYESTREKACTQSEVRDSMLAYGGVVICWNTKGGMREHTQSLNFTTRWVGEGEEGGGGRGERSASMEIGRTSQTGYTHASSRDTRNARVQSRAKHRCALGEERGGGDG